jgi:tripartite-type tricarboxylate transporter receptor subunit TctC
MKIASPVRGRFEALCRAALLVVAIAVPQPSIGTDPYPSRTVRIVVSFPPGTTTDTLARTVAMRLGEALGQPVIVDNRPGGAGNVGLALAAKAAADGYTLTIGGAAMCINPAIYGAKVVDPVRDFAPVAKLASSPIVIVAHPSVRASTLQELIVLARNVPQKLAYSTPGVGTPTHVAAELLAQRADIELLHVPYPGSGQLLTDVISAEVPVAFTLLGAAQPFLKSGQLKAIATTGRERIAALPDTPTVAESGYPGYEVTTWYSILVPAGTSAEVVERLNRELLRVMALPDVRERLIAIGMVPETSTPRELAMNIRTEVARWGPIVRAAGIVQE